MVSLNDKKNMIQTFFIASIEQTSLLKKRETTLSLSGAMERVSLQIVSLNPDPDTDPDPAFLVNRDLSRVLMTKN
jgi:hypothetical protein